MTGLDPGASIPQTSPWASRSFTCSRRSCLHLLDLLGQGLAKATLRRHRDNLWMLGGELIRCRYDDDELASKQVNDALRPLIESDGGPLMWPCITEPEQDSLDTTSRRLDRFWRESAAGKISD